MQQAFPVSVGAQEQGVDESSLVVHGDRDQPVRVGGDARSVAVTTVRKAWPSMARMTQRCQDVQRRDLVLVESGEAFAGLE